MNNEPSIYQAKIFDVVKNTRNNVLIKAGPGSGKSTTLIECAGLVPESASKIFLAFNKSIVKELESKLPESVECKTLHSLGYATLFKYFKGTKLKITKNKSYIIAKNACSENSDAFKLKVKDMNKIIFITSKIIDFCRMYLIDPEDVGFDDFALNNGFILKKNEMSFAKFAYKSFISYNTPKKRSEMMIDFIDMIHIPASVDSIELKKYMYIFVDEAQDLNFAQQILVSKIRNPRSRIFVVGDPKQSIYRFAGADSNSWDNFSSIDKIQELDLPICYRCGNAIVEEARKIYDEIEPWEMSKEGEVFDAFIDDVESGDMVLCRNNAPLISLFFDFLEDGKPSHIKGKNFLEDIIGLFSKKPQRTVDEAIQKLYEDRQSVYTKLLEWGVANPTKNQKYIQFNDAIEIIKIIRKNTGAKNVKSIILELDTIYDEKNGGIELMTIHKSKGLEADNVYFLLPQLIPSDYAITKEDLEQEQNLKWVATTRAKKKLGYIREYDLRQN